MRSDTNTKFTTVPDPNTKYVSLLEIVGLFFLSCIYFDNCGKNIP